MHKMNQTQPNFTKLSSLNPNKDKKKLPTMRPGFYADMLKRNQFNLLNN